MGRVCAAGIFVCVDATPCTFGNRNRLTNEPNNKSPASKDSTNSQRLNKQPAMNKPFILCCITLLAIAPLYVIQGKPPKAGKSAANESTITDLEKSAWEAYKNKQADAFKALMSKEYYGVYAEGIKNLDAELADMAKSDLRDYSFSDIKVVFPHPKMAVMTYKAKVQATADGKDMSGTYNSGSVWIQQGGKWVGAFHTEAKTQ
jgi:hypothetical protein